MSIPELPRASGAPAPEGESRKARLAADIDIEHMTLAELLALHTRVEARLPPLTIKDVSLEKTLMLQLITSQELQKQTLEDKEATPTQKSQVTNTLSGVIDTLSKLQIKLFSSERMKEIEAVLIDTVNDHMTPEQQQAFFQEYRRRLGAEALP
jgi:hypothetical protein